MQRKATHDSVEGAVAEVLVEREGKGQPPLPAAQPHVPGEVRVRVIDRVLGKGVALGLGSWLWPGLEFVLGFRAQRSHERIGAAALTESCENGEQPARGSDREPARG